MLSWCDSENVFIEIYELYLYHHNLETVCTPNFNNILGYYLIINIMYHSIFISYVLWNNRMIHFVVWNVEYDNPILKDAWYEAVSPCVRVKRRTSLSGNILLRNCRALPVLITPQTMFLCHLSGFGSKRGFANIDGIDWVEQYINNAGNRNIYEYTYIYITYMMIYTQVCDQLNFAVVVQ